MIRRAALVVAVIGATVVATAPASSATAPSRRSVCVGIAPVYGACTENPAEVVVQIVNDLKP